MECIEYHDTHCVNYSTESNHSYCFDEEIQDNKSNEAYTNTNNNVNSNFTISKPLVIEVSKALANLTKGNTSTQSKAPPKSSNFRLEKLNYSINSKVIDIACICKDEVLPETNTNNVDDTILTNTNTQQQQPTTNSMTNNNDSNSNNKRPIGNEEHPISRILNLKQNKTIYSAHSSKLSSIVVKKLPKLNNKRFSKAPLIKNVLYNKILNKQQNPLHLLHHKVFDNDYHTLLSVETIRKNRPTSALSKGVSKRTTSVFSITARDRPHDVKNMPHQFNRTKSATVLPLKDNSSAKLKEIRHQPSKNSNNSDMLREQEYLRRKSTKSHLYFNLVDFTKMKNVWNVHTLNTNKVKEKEHAKEYKKIIFGLDNNNNNSNGKKTDAQGNKYVLRKSKSISICRETSVGCKEKDSMTKNIEPQRECGSNKREENKNKAKYKRKMC